MFLVGQTVGFVLLGIALWRARVLPVWLGLVLAASGPAHLLLPGGNLGTAVSWAMTAIGYVGASVALWRMPNTDFDLPPTGRAPAPTGIGRGRRTGDVAGGTTPGPCGAGCWRSLPCRCPSSSPYLRYLLPYSDGDAPQEIFAKLVAATSYQNAVLWLGIPVVLCGFAGALAVAWLTRRRTPVLTTIAMALSVPGYIALFAGGSYGDLLSYVTGTVPGLDFDTAFQLGFAMESSPQSGALGLIFVAGHLFGTTLIGIALWRARVAPTWLAIGLTVSQPIHLASVMTGIRPLDLVGWGLTAVGFTWAAWRLARLPNDEFDLPPTDPPGQSRHSGTAARSRQVRRMSRRPGCQRIQVPLQQSLSHRSRMRCARTGTGPARTQHLHSARTRRSGLPTHRGGSSRDRRQPHHGSLPEVYRTARRHSALAGAVSYCAEWPG